MALKVGINGFGRIGRLVFRAGIKNPNIEFVGINDLVPPDNLAYLLKHDSTHGRYKGTVEARADGIVVDGKFVPCVSVRNPEELPWGKNNAEYVVESTGLVHRLRGRRQAPQGRSQARGDLRPDQGQGRRGSDAGDGRERQQVRSGQAHDRLQRKLHDQLPGSGREGDRRQLRAGRRA